MREFAEFVCFAPGWFGVNDEGEAITRAGKMRLLERVSKGPESRSRISLIRTWKDATQRKSQEKQFGDVRNNHTSVKASRCRCHRSTTSSFSGRRLKPRWWLIRSHVWLIGSKRWLMNTRLPHLLSVWLNENYITLFVHFDSLTFKDWLLFILRCLPHHATSKQLT